MIERSGRLKYKPVEFYYTLSLLHFHHDFDLIQYKVRRSNMNEAFE